MRSQFATYSTIYRVEVAVPEDVFRAFGHTPEYEQVSLSAARIVETSGQDAYHYVVEWGEAPTHRRCEEFATHWHNWILQWQQSLRSGPR